jgi:parallel beta-helix repeat protein
VTTTADSGAGSLREAITAAAAGGPDDIVFDPGGTGTLNIATQLPMLSTGTTVTATRTNGVPDVELHCSDPSVGTGLQAGPGQTDVVVTGVSITNCTNGIFVLADGGLTLRSSWIGRTRAGSTSVNTVNGFGALAGARIVVGGPSAGDGNLIVGSASGVGAVDPAAGAVVQGNTISGAGGRGVNLTNADGVVVQDNVVSGNATSGIALVRGAGAVIRGNRVGTDAAGVAAQPNGVAGINLVGTVGATIGGTGPGDPNVVAGSVGGETRCAICVQPDGVVRATGTVIAGNRVGTAASGVAALSPAGFDGIRVVNAVDTTIGGTAPSAGNVVGGFANSGITIQSGSSGTVIQGNTVGLAADASGAIRNDIGIGVTADSPGTRIGGTAAGARNVVSGNRIGVYTGGPGTQIEGNLVGLAPDGRTVVGNEQGIALDGAAAGMRVGANVVSGNLGLGVVLKNTAGAVVAANLIGRTADGAESRPNGPLGGVLLIDSSGGVVGGDTPADANLIDGGVHPSIRAEGAGQLGTQLLGNQLRGTPHSLGIDLVPLAVTANDPGDADTGPNGLQNAPVVTTARPTAVTGTIGTKPSTAARIQVFSASAGGRETYALLGEHTVTTDGAGAAAFSIPVTATEGGSVVATATTSDGTSELSAPALVLVPRFGLARAKFTVGARKLRVRIRNGTDADVRVRVKGKDTRKSVRAAGTLKAVTKTIKPRRHGSFQLKLPASTRRKLAATLKRKGKATYRPTVTVTNRSSGVKRTYKPKIKVTRKKRT